MKSLNLARPTIMLVAGIPGAGKSFFATRFSETFVAPVVSYDRIRYELFAEPRFSPEERDLIGRLADYQIGELCKAKRSFLIDGGGETKAERARLNEQAKQAGYELLVIWVQTHETTARARALKRSPRREGDKYNVSLTTEQFAKLCNHFTAPQRENYMVISGMHTYATQAKAVLRKLAAPRESEADSAHQAENEALQQTARHSAAPRRSVIIR